MTNSDIVSSDHTIDNYRFEKGANWEAENVRTILQWLHIAAINLDVMTEASHHYRKLIRRNTIIGLIMSTLASTASLSQFSISETEYPGITTGLKIAFTLMSATVAIFAGYLKIYQVQEKLEKAIKLQQEWSLFGSLLSSEIQLPINLRKDALYLIIKYKETYSELFKQQIDISQRIVQRVAVRNGLQANSLSLSELFERVLEGEAERLKVTDNEHGDHISIDANSRRINSTQHIRDNKIDNQIMNDIDVMKKVFRTILTKKHDKQPINEKREKMTRYIMKPTQVIERQSMQIKSPSKQNLASPRRSSLEDDFNSNKSVSTSMYSDPDEQFHSNRPHLEIIEEQNENNSSKI